MNSWNKNTNWNHVPPCTVKQKNTVPRPTLDLVPHDDWWTASYSRSMPPVDKALLTQHRIAWNPCNVDSWFIHTHPDVQGGCINLESTLLGFVNGSTLTQDSTTSEKTSWLFRKTRPYSSGTRFWQAQTDRPARSLCARILQPEPKGGSIKAAITNGKIIKTKT